MSLSAGDRPRPANALGPGVRQTPPGPVEPPIALGVPMRILSPAPAPVHPAPPAGAPDAQSARGPLPPDTPSVVPAPADDPDPWAEYDGYTWELGPDPDDAAWWGAENP